MAVGSPSVFRFAAGLAFLAFAPALATAPAAADVPESPTFDQVLATPDDPDINLSYARAQADAGNLLSAAAALERILLAHPNAHGVRLFYAATLYRLDDLQGARQQLKLLDGVKLSPLQDAERRKYESFVDQGQSKWRVAGYVSAGVAVDSNAIGALLNQLDFLGPVIAKNGGAAVIAGDLRVSDEVGPSGTDSIFADAAVYNRSTFAGPNADFQRGELRLGYMRTSLMNAWEINAVARHYLIFDKPYLTEIGAQAQASWRPSTSITWNFGFEAVAQDYSQPSVDILVSEHVLPGTQNGARFDATIGASWRADSRQTLGFTLGFEGKTAGYEPFAYYSPSLEGNYHVLLGEGVYADLTGGVRYVVYGAPDPVFLLGTSRTDVRTDLRAALGAPLSAFSPEGATGDERENMILEASVNYVDRTSRSPVVPYSGVGGELRLVWKFGGRR